MAEKTFTYSEITEAAEKCIRLSLDQANYAEATHTHDGYKKAAGYRTAALGMLDFWTELTAEHPSYAARDRLNGLIFTN